jgi:hypothetical protein
MRNKFSTLVSAAIVLAALASANVSSAQPIGPDEVLPVGTYATGKATVGNIKMLVLKANGTYHAEFWIRSAGALIGHPEDGTYSTEHGEEPAFFHFLNLNPKRGEQRHFDYSVADDEDAFTLTTPAGVAVKLVHQSKAWCRVNLDCNQQGIEIIPEDQLKCQAHTCSMVGPFPRLQPCSDNSPIRCEIVPPKCGPKQVLGSVDGCFGCVDAKTCE